MDCVGTETTLLSCPLSRAIGSVRCSYNAIAGVVCPSEYLSLFVSHAPFYLLITSGGGPACTNNAIRLVDKNTWTPFNNRGRVEICNANQWKTICDDGWSSNDAKVACYQLGFTKNCMKLSSLLLFLLFSIRCRYLLLCSIWSRVWSYPLASCGLFINRDFTIPVQ